MVLSKYILDFDIDFDFDLIGISSALPGYKIAWYINKLLNINLSRIGDHIVSITSKTNVGEISFEKPEDNSFRYSRYKYEISSQDISYDLISFKSQGQPLSKEIAEFDYLLKIEAPQDLAADCVTILHEAEPFNLVQLIEIENLNLEFISTLQ